MSTPAPGTEERPLAGPGICQRRYVLWPGRAECPDNCPGRQEDGTCLADIIRSANEQGIEWSFDVRPHPDIDGKDGGVWIYDGPPLEVTPLTIGEEVEPPTFLCPHCGNTNVQDLSNFHFWCAYCGKNAKDLAS